jgi:hypothetical protein
MGNLAAGLAVRQRQAAYFFHGAVTTW